MDDSRIHTAGLGYWCAARWAFLVFNVVIVSGWVYWLMSSGVHVTWVTWITRCLVTTQLVLGVSGLCVAYRQRLSDTAGAFLVVEAWAYFVMAILCGLVLALPLV